MSRTQCYSTGEDRLIALIVKLEIQTADLFVYVKLYEMLFLTRFLWVSIYGDLNGYHRFFEEGLQESVHYVR